MGKLVFCSKAFRKIYIFFKRPHTFFSSRSLKGSSCFLKMPMRMIMCPKITFDILTICSLRHCFFIFPTNNYLGNLCFPALKLGNTYFTYVTSILTMSKYSNVSRGSRAPPSYLPGYATANLYTTKSM